MTLINSEEKPPAGSAEKQSSSSSSHGSSEWGYDLYPERRGAKPSSSFTDMLLGRNGRGSYRKIDCERSVYKCIKTSPLVRLMVGALKSAGCPIDIRRHISCEECAPHVSGGYDPILNQVLWPQTGNNPSTVILPLGCDMPQQHLQRGNGPGGANARVYSHVRLLQKQFGL